MAAVVVQVKKSVVAPVTELPTATPGTPVEGFEADSETDLESNSDSDLDLDSGSEVEATGAGPTGVARPFVDVDPVKVS